MPLTTFSASSIRPCAARNRTDSGNLKNSTGSSSSGRTPPTTKTECQSQVAISQVETRPPMVEPSGKPQNITVTRVARRRAGPYSLVRAMMFGMAAPRPMPVMKR